MFISSQPGTLESTAMLISTFEWSANADGVIAIIEKTVSNTNNEYTDFLTFWFFLCLLFNLIGTEIIVIIC